MTARRSAAMIARGPICPRCGLPMFADDHRTADDCVIALRDALAKVVAYAAPIVDNADKIVGAVWLHGVRGHVRTIRDYLASALQPRCPGYDADNDVDDGVRCDPEDCIENDCPLCVWSYVRARMEDR